MQQWRIADLRCKEVINISDGERLGFVDDVLLDAREGKLLALIVPGPCRFFGMFAHEDDYVIPWEKINRIGDDIILVDVNGDLGRSKRPKKQWL